MTKIIALETSGRSGSVALLAADAEHVRVVCERELPAQSRTAQALAPEIATVLKEEKWQPADISLVAVSNGPGSFTGLRIGVTAAKTMAYAVGADLIGINTLRVLAEQTPVQNSKLWAIMDAQREELFAATFAANEAGSWSEDRATQIISIQDWLVMVRPGEIVTGPILGRLREKISEGVELSPSDTWQPCPATVGKLAWKDFKVGRRDDVWQMVPNYYRLSAAEEKLGRQETQK